MSVTATIPTWVSPAPGQVADAHRLTHAFAQADQDPDRGQRYRGACAAITWVVGLQPAPMTERTDEPSAEVVRGEMMLADSVAAAAPPPPTAMWVALGVDPRPSVTSHRGWASGVADTLGWLLGVHDRPPVPLPRRLPDGSTPTVDHLYDEYVAGTWGSPEERQDARRRAEKDAALYRRLAELAHSAS